MKEKIKEGMEKEKENKNGKRGGINIKTNISPPIYSAGGDQLKGWKKE